MPSSTAKSAFPKGLRDGTPFVVLIIPFALLFGVVATEAGLSVVEVMGFSALVIAGAAQFTAVQLMLDDAPTLIVLATSLAVNLRMAMYSAAMVPHIGTQPLWKRAFVAYALVDQIYAASVSEYDRRPEMTQAQKIGYFLGMASVIAPTWYVGTYVGAVAGAGMIDGFDVSIGLPIVFLAMVGPMMRTLAHVAAALTSVVLAVLLAEMPAGTELLVAGMTAMIVGAGVEQLRSAKS